MKKLHIPAITLPKYLNKTVILVAVAALVVLSLIVFGVVRSVQAERVANIQATESRLQREAEAKELVALRAEVDKLKKANMFQTAKSESVCDWVRSTQPRYRYTVPPLCQLPKN